MATGYASPSFASGPRFRTWRPSPPALIVLALLAIGSLPIGGCSYIFSEKRTVYEYEPSYGVDSPEFRRSLDAFGTEMVPHNRAVLLQNGDAIFDSMEAAFRAARQSINVETYLFDDGTAGTRFA
ncbi:MAG TPA: hypothetical protein VIY96_05545, partial [Thermoanaerobaculia bacterium]